MAEVSSPAGSSSTPTSSTKSALSVGAGLKPSPVGDGWPLQADLDGPVSLALEQLELRPQRVDVGQLEVVCAVLDLGLAVQLAVRDALVPSDVDEVARTLEVHREPFESVSDLDGRRDQVEAATLLEVGELRDLQPVQPDLPAQPPGAKRRRLPVVFDEAHVVVAIADAERLEALQVEPKWVRRTRLQDDLVL